jgi:gas vesicle protein
MTDDVLPSSEDAAPSGASFVSGLLIGALAGAALAMIFAPQTGEETRDILYAKARETTERMRDTAEDVSATASAAATGVGSKVGEVFEDVSAGANDLYSRGKTIVDEARARVDAAVDEGKAAAAEQRTTLEETT